MSEPNQQDRPNVIWIFGDQMRGHAMSCAGDPNVRTPVMDRLASRGVRFSSACSTYPLCVPFRFTLLTGEYAHTRWIPALHWRMSPVERTAAHDFNDAGYETVYIGKWHLNGSIPLTNAKDINRTPVLPGYRGGFKTWYGFNLRNGYFDTCCFHGDDPTPVPLGKYQTDGLFDIAVDYLDRRVETSAPFFMTLSVEAPHPPHEAPGPYLERVRRREMAMRENYRIGRADDGADEKDLLGEDICRDVIAGYYAQIENLDDNLGRFMDCLENKGLLDNTIIVFFSDHGEMLGSHGRRQKQFPYEESINIPFIVYDPRLPVERHGTVLDEPICTEDIYPTTLALAGLSPDRPKPGLDLGPYLRGEVEALPREGVYLEFVEEDRNAMVLYRSTWRGFRGRRYKYTILNGRPWQLFDIQTDPFEQNNLVDSPEYAETLKTMEDHLRRVAHETGDNVLWEDQRS